IAQEFNQDYLGTEHILYSMLTQKNARATVLLRDMSVDIATLTSELEDYFERQGNSSSDSAADFQVYEAKKSKGKGGVLDTFGTDLTDKARRGELDPVIGRKKEEER